MIPALSHAWSEILSRALLPAVSYLRWSDALLQQCFGQSSRATMLTHCRTLCRCIRDIGILADTLVIDVAQVCYVTHRLLVCVVFAFVCRIVVFSVIWSLSAVRLFVPCIVVADPIGCLSYSRLVRRSVEFRHFL